MSEDPGFSWAICPDDDGQIWRLGDALYSVRFIGGDTSFAGFHRLTKKGRRDKRHRGFSGGASWLTEHGCRVRGEEMP